MSVRVHRQLAKGNEKVNTIPYIGSKHGCHGSQYAGMSRTTKDRLVTMLAHVLDDRSDHDGLNVSPACMHNHSELQSGRARTEGNDRETYPAEVLGEVLAWSDGDRVLANIFWCAYMRMAFRRWGWNARL